LNARGKLETLMLGAGTMREAISDLVPGANFIARPRLSKLTYAGEKKLTRLPTRSAVVSFSANDVYSIAELVRRQRGGCAVVLGALSPRTRNAQVALFQSGDVDFLIATDAIGMGLNLDVEHVAIAQTRKFDGEVHRELTPAELGQIAGRAGRHLNDGTFGVTAGVDGLSADLVERLENHTFDNVKTLQWRARDLDFANLHLLRESLRQLPREQRLQRARMADDVLALETLSSDREITDLAIGRKAVELLWDVCQVPDYRKISTQNHAELVATLYKALMTGDRRIPEDWLAMQVAVSDRTDGDIDTLSNRLAHIRTWTFVSNRPGWLADPLHWQEKTRAVEDSLSDALHECLTQRFVDRRTSALMRGMREKSDMVAEIADDGAIHVEKHFVGRLKGFRFQPETQAEDVHGKATRAAAAHVLAKELSMRARRVASAKSDALKLTPTGDVLWRDEVIASLVKGDDPLKPLIELRADEHLTGPDKEKVQERLNAWIAEVIAERLKPLFEIAKAEDVIGLARGIAFRMKENLGVLRRETVAEEIKTLDQAARGQLRKYGVRFGAFNIFFPTMLKPASAELALILWLLQDQAKVDGRSGLTLDSLPQPPRPGLTSVATNAALPDAYYRCLGFHVCGPRAVRVDMLERLADLIRPLLAWRRDPAKPEAVPPNGSTGDGAFIVTPAMMSILGCSAAELGAILNVLGFRSEQRPKPAAVVAVPPPEASTPPPAEAEAEPAASVETAPPADAVAAAEATVAAAPSIDAVLASSPEPPSGVVAGPSAAPVPLSEPVSEPSASTAEPQLEAPAASAAAPSLASPEMMEVWRPRRRHQQHDRAHRRGRPAAPGGQASAGGPAASPEARKPWQRDRQRDQARDRRDRPSADRPPMAGADPAAPTQRTEPPRHKDNNPRSQPRGDRGGDRGDRSTKRFGDRRGDRPPQQFKSGPAKTRGPDPDSPFAKLSALKAALEKGAAKE
jgi:ATP-dependent RNA helicase SUPV3L1/SUV3